jgi:hypothetical protein
LGHNFVGAKKLVSQFLGGSGGAEELGFDVHLLPYFEVWGWETSFVCGSLITLLHFRDVCF